MNTITRINHVGIRVSNMERARKFYETLCFKWLVGPVGPEPVAIMEHLPSGTCVNLILNAVEAEKEGGNVLMDVPVKRAGYTHMALEVPDIEAVVADLEKAGITITERINLPSDGKSLFIRDPDYNVVEYHQVGNPPWPPKEGI